MAKNDQILSEELTERDLSALCRKFPTKNWKVIFIRSFLFTEAELQQAEYDNRGAYRDSPFL